MAPLYFFLASSLNAQLVYIILKGITQLHKCFQKGHISTELALNNVTLISDINAQDLTIQLTKIKVKNYNFWSQTNLKTSKCVAKKLREDNMMVIDEKVIVTYYSIQRFQETFHDFFKSTSILSESLSPKYNRERVFKAGEGTGRSGSFFFFSHDEKFIVKTMKKTELDLLLKLLPLFSTHFMKNKNSLLAKIVGVFTVKCRQMNNVHIMLMENTLCVKDESRLKYIFDLKGSIVDRKVEGMTTKTTTLKDINFRMAAKVNKNFTKFRETDR